MLFLFISLGVVPASACHAEDLDAVASGENKGGERVPDHEIRYEEKLSPDWIASWDAARALYRDEMYPEALVQYEILFSQKENIDEARWEYCSILMHLERWESARSELEKLLAAEPESIRYRLAMARASVETGNLDNAVALYSRLQDEQISDRENIMVLEGLIKAYEMKGQADKVSELLERLILLKPQDSALQLKQAVLELEMGNALRARELCENLEESLPHDIDLLSLHARIEENLHHKDMAVSYWRKVLAVDPDNLGAHRYLCDYYYENGNWEESYNSLKSLIKSRPDDVSLLERAAELNMKMDRIDRALHYYEYGLAVDPLNMKLVTGKEHAQKKLAADLLSLVENNGSKKLWQDLVRVAPDSAGIYREIAVLLREKQKVDELIEVLALLYRQDPDDQLIYEELAGLLEQQGMIEQLSALRAGKAAMDQPDNQ
ncbi:MAG: tetratricopeptide repeat protein [Desulfobulbaceae bacterium]|nr:tetratricopeptide repeat protein [Desulfobulbaceae bacterium]